jgi:hypothetical protein
MANSKKTALAITEKTEKNNLTENTGFLGLADNDISGMLADELEGLDLKFERIKIPSAGSTVFEAPGEDGESDTVKEFSAVILLHHVLYCYYKSKYVGGNNPPDCGSFDGVIGIGDPGGDCVKCPLNRFGSGENGAKACKNRRRIYVLREGEVFPLLLSLPTGSLNEFTKYIRRLLTKGRKSNMVVTRFSLRKAISTGGIAYSQAQFAMDRPLSPEEVKYIEKQTELIQAFSRSVAFDTEREAELLETDYTVAEGTGDKIVPLGAKGAPNGVNKTLNGGGHV